MLGKFTLNLGTGKKTNVNNQDTNSRYKNNDRYFESENLKDEGKFFIFFFLTNIMTNNSSRSDYY